MLQIAHIIVTLLALYGAVGFIFALYFVTLGVRGAGVEGRALILRLMLIPGALLLWPILLKKRTS